MRRRLRPHDGMTSTMATEVAYVNRRQRRVKQATANRSLADLCSLAGEGIARERRRRRGLKTLQRIVFVNTEESIYDQSAIEHYLRWLVVVKGLGLDSQPLQRFRL